MVLLYMDVHVHSAITRGLRTRGVDVLTAQEDSAAELDDPLLLDRATELRRVLVTQDRDFLGEGARRQRSGEPFAGILYAPQSTAAIGIYIRDLELIALASEPHELADRLLYLPF
jgi:predicted nuclease of predicted toxin-antitoxin system